MNILHISTADNEGGAARSAFRLHTGLIELGHSSFMLVGRQVETGPEIDRIPVRRTLSQKVFYRHNLMKRLEYRTGLQYLLLPWRNQFLHHPFTQQADVINLHNIHGGFFSYTILPRLSQVAPIVWTLLDMWSLSGHCSYPSVYDCDRWKTGCGSCPALDDYPPISIDTTALLWWMKHRAYRRSRITLVTPSSWAAEMASQSPLLKQFEIHSIPLGLNTTVFKPIPKNAARMALGLPANSHIVLFSAFDLLYRRKGGAYLFEALQRVVSEGNRGVMLVTVGSNQIRMDEQYSFPMRHLGLINDDHLLATCYSAADLYIGPSLADGFGQVFSESMACGTPVVAFECTGVREVVRHMETGYLARYKDTDDLTHGIRLLLGDDTLREKLGRRGREVVEEEYTIQLETQRYVSLYQKLMEGRQHASR